MNILVFLCALFFLEMETSKIFKLDIHIAQWSFLSDLFSVVSFSRDVGFHLYFGNLPFWSVSLHGSLFLSNKKFNNHF